MATLTQTFSVVATRQGKVRGVASNGVRSFKGIPYAEPPFGPNRFRAPQAVEPWGDVHEALEFGPKSPQPVYPPEVQLLLPESVGSGENCLTLNIWAPEVGEGLPVMVWIPGGVFEYHATGACPWYDGTSFARDGVVCVTIGYRPGPDGFLYFGEGDANLGLLDQVAALLWVRDNIDAFGGDPHNVTVFGESAGALSIGCLLAMPRAAGLFRRAICQSGAAHHAISVDDAKRVGEDLARRLGVPPSREDIAEVPIERLIRAQTELRMDLAMHPDPSRWGRDVLLSMLPWQPVIDGRTLPERPIDRITKGAGAKVDLMVGTNDDENRLFLMGGFDKVSSEALAGTIAAYGLPVERTLAAYRKVHPSAHPGDLMAAIQTDWYWRIPAIRLVDAHAPDPGSTYMYEFGWRSPAFGGQLGACHALEIGFVFDILGKGTEPMMGANPPQSLANEMHSAWVAFATTGDPGWPKYDLQRRATERFDVISSVVEDPRSAERALWEGVR